VRRIGSNTGSGKLSRLIDARKCDWYGTAPAGVSSSRTEPRGAFGHFLVSANHPHQTTSIPLVKFSLPLTDPLVRKTGVFQDADFRGFSLESHTNPG